MKTWPTKKLGEIAECVDGDWILSRDLRTGREVRLIQLGDIGESIFLDKTDKWISKKRCKELNCTTLKAGDILLLPVLASRWQKRVYSLALIIHVLLQLM